MASKVTQLVIELSPLYSDDEKIAIAEAVVEHIRKRTAQGKGVGGSGKIASSYSPEYAGSLDFKNAGKSKNKVNMELSGDMMGALDVLGIKKNKVMIGWEPGSDEEPIAEGNILGTYGQSAPIPGKAKNFFGITKSELAEILTEFPLDDLRKSRENADVYRLARSGAERFGFDEGDDG